MKEACSECLNYLFEIYDNTNKDAPNADRTIVTEKCFSDITDGSPCKQQYNCLPLQILKTRIENETKRTNV